MVLLNLVSKWFEEAFRIPFHDVAVIDISHTGFSAMFQVADRWFRIVVIEDNLVVTDYYRETYLEDPIYDSWLDWGEFRAAMLLIMARFLKPHSNTEPSTGPTVMIRQEIMTEVVMERKHQT